MKSNGAREPDVQQLAANASRRMEEAHIMRSAANPVKTKSAQFKSTRLRPLPNLVKTPNLTFSP